MNKLDIKFFKAFKDLSIEFKVENFLLYGENGAGKSSIYEALKVVFFKNRIEKEIRKVSIPEEQDQINKNFWAKYNNNITNKDFEIKINNIDYKNFINTDYQTFMVSIEGLTIEDRIKLDTLLSNFYLDIADINSFCSAKHLEIQNEVNQLLAEFNENVKIVIEKEEDYTIKIIDINRGLERNSEIKKYFNEAKLNLIILLLLFTSIKKSLTSSKKYILILDDFITSLDAANRTFLMKYLLKEFSKFQLLIFTHNVTFYNLIMYLIDDYVDQKERDRWSFANIYEIEGNNKLYFKDSISVSKIETSMPAVVNDGNIENIGNQIRQAFEILLYEFSKLFMVGSVEESSNIILRIKNNKNIYLKLDNIDNKKIYLVSDLIDEIDEVLNGTHDDRNLKPLLKSKIDEYKLNDLENLKQIVKELKLYQKVTMHPMSHATIGQNTFTTKEIKSSILLLKKLETYLKSIRFKDVSSI